MSILNDTYGTPDLGDPKGAWWNRIQIIQGGTPDKHGVVLDRFADIHLFKQPDVSVIPCLCHSTDIWTELIDWLADNHAFCHNTKTPVWVRVLYPSQHDTPLPPGAQLIDQRAVHITIGTLD
ncbi:hypothetical protein [Allonocardiopsis opalescens]|uniref:Uncharacterized protein n=1 Tax=Allonocardiopsis opalescens TaxID=1144618 RepID=A0A2T0QCC4_9ACTN|nr:hypothetical protein [Allonocardiopsis opalescens]PRY01562.1 hypothetical protein CLV72_101145 [Allonocardiopsis opalescens]